MFLPALKDGASLAVPRGDVVSELWIRDGGTWKRPTISLGGLQRVFFNTDQHQNREYPTADGAWHAVWEIDTGIPYDEHESYAVYFETVGKIGNSDSHNFRYNMQGGAALAGSTGQWAPTMFSTDSGMLDGTQWHDFQYSHTVDIPVGHWTPSQATNIMIKLWMSVTEDGTRTETYQALFTGGLSKYTQLEDIWVHSGGAWHQVTEAQVSVGGAWRS
jgi:outer membrane receptor protein involved in Fe transport